MILDLHRAKIRIAQVIALAGLSLVLLTFLGIAFLFVGCTGKPAAGQVQYDRTEYHETGTVKSRTTLTVAQNEDPDSPTSIRVGEPLPLDIVFGSSFVRAIPKSFAHMESILVASGIICLLAAAALGGIGKHIKLMTIAAGTGLGLIALAVTIEEYAWAYGLALVIAAAAAGWYLWQRYKAQLQFDDIPF